MLILKQAVKVGQTCMNHVHTLPKELTWKNRNLSVCLSKALNIVLNDFGKTYSTHDMRGRLKNFPLGKLIHGDNRNYSGLEAINEMT